MLPFSLPGFEVQQVQYDKNVLVILSRALSPMAPCPRCQQVSRRVHSYYTHTPRDLPVSGQQVRLVLQVRRFRCQNRLCQQQTFVEQIPEVVARSARRTTRLSATMMLFAGGLSGQLGSYLLSRMGIPFSPDTLWRLAKRAASQPVKAPKHLELIRKP